jgi:hypothetical protein
MNANRMAGAARNDSGVNEQRQTARRTLGVPGRLVWKDARGATRFNSVVIRDVSDTGAYVESLSGAAIPLYRLVSLQTERDVETDQLPTHLRQGRVLSAVYRVGPASRLTGAPEGYGLRLLVEPRRRPAVPPLPAITPHFAGATA